MTTSRVMYHSVRGGIQHLSRCVNVRQLRGPYHSSASTTMGFGNRLFHNSRYHNALKPYLLADIGEGKVRLDPSKRFAS